MSVSLGRLIDNGYSNRQQQEKDLNSKGYKKDHALSNQKTQIFHNPESGHLIKNINGTRTLADIATDAAVGLGLGHNTQRYKEEKNNLEKAKKKYNPKSTTIAGSSLGGYLASAISDKNDKVVTLNRPSIPFTPIPKNETHYRVKGDVISLNGANAKHTKTLPAMLSGKWYPNAALSLASQALASHKSANLLNQKIYV